MSATNTSRPPMERAIRHGDGTMITASEWAAIKATARMVKSDLLSLPPSRDRRAKERTKSKGYFRTYFRKEWDAAVAKMESVQPLLALCASHWKAEHVLGNTLLVKVAVDSEGDESDSPVENVDKSPISESKKRRVKGRSREKKRQKKSNEISRLPNGEAGKAPSGEGGDALNDKAGAMSNGRVSGTSNGRVGATSNGNAGATSSSNAGTTNAKVGATSNGKAGATSNDKAGELNGTVGGMSNDTSSELNGSRTQGDKVGGVTNSGTDGAPGNKAGEARPEIGTFLVGKVRYNSELTYILSADVHTASKATAGHFIILARHKPICDACHCRCELHPRCHIQYVSRLMLYRPRLLILAFSTS